jgi:Icc protein
VRARIVQLTDLHLTAAEGGRTWGSDVWRNLDAMLDHLRALEPFDLLVLSGDLANQRRPATYARLRERLHAFAGRLRVLPGNHDSRRLLRAHFGDLLLEGAPAANFVHELAGWRIVGLDSVRRPFVHGKFGARQLAWLRDLLQATPQPVLLFVHHPPVAIGTWWLDKDRPRDRAAFARALAGGPVRAIACGHVHQPHEGEFAGARVFTAPSTAYQFPPRARLPGAGALAPAGRVFELDGTSLTTRIVAPALAP